MTTPVARWSYRNTKERQLSDLPVLPATVMRLLALDQDRTEFFEELAAVVEDEPGLATRLVALANSAAYARGKIITRVKDAAVRVGADASVDLVLAASVARVFVPREPWEVALWIHAIRVAAFARCLASFCDPKEVCPDTAHLAGLLHELGRFVWFQEASWALRDLAGVVPDERGRAERALLGIDHQRLGAEAAARWGLPTLVVTVLQRFGDHDPTFRLGGVIRVADRLDPSAGGTVDTFPEEGMAERLQLLLPPWFPVPAARILPAFRQAVFDAHARVAIVLPGVSVAIPEPPGSLSVTPGPGSWSRGRS